MKKFSLICTVLFTLFLSCENSTNSTPLPFPLPHPTPTPTPVALAAPSYVTVDTSSGTYYAIQWEAIDDVQYYRMYAKSVTNGTSAPFTSPLDQHPLNWRNIATGATFDYTIQAVNDTVGPYQIGISTVSQDNVESDITWSNTFDKL